MTHSDDMNKSNWLGSVKSTNNVVRVKKKKVTSRNSTLLF